MKPMNQRWTITVLALALALGAIAPATVSAQDVQITGPLAGQPAVRRMRMYRQSRLQLIPTIGFTLQDEFSRSVMTGLEANFNIFDFLGVGVWAAFANFGNNFHIDTDLTGQVVLNGQTTDRNRLSMPNSCLDVNRDGVCEQSFADQVARLQGVVAFQAIFAPLRGKLSLFQGVFVDTDFYVMGGLALAFIEERQAVVAGPGAGQSDAMSCQRSPTSGMINDLGACNASQTARAQRIAPAPTFGVGLNLYFNQFLGLALQWRAFPFDMNPAGTDESGLDSRGNPGGGFPDRVIDGRDNRLYFHHMINIGLIISLPPDATVSQ